MPLLTKNNLNEVIKLIKDKYLSFFSEELIKDYRKYFTDTHKDSLKAIIFYGSCLNDKTKKKTSTPDFFLIVDNYYSFHKSIIHSALNWILTPNTYSINKNGLKGKYNVLSSKHFNRETSLKAKDIYNLGRLSKRTAIIYHSDESVLKNLIESFANAYYTVAFKTCFLQNIFSLEDFITQALNISYIGEKRVEADDKISKLKKSETKFYESIYKLILDDFLSSKLLEKKDDIYSLRNAFNLTNRFWKIRTKIFLWKSRIRAKLRWPKSIYTFEGWVDTLLSKIERTKGIKIELTEKERKYPLIYGWKYYFRFKRDKTLK